MAFQYCTFEEYLARAGIDWPRLETGKLDLRRKTFESMCKSWPVLEPLRQLRYTRDKLRRIKLAVGADNRHRTMLWPFQSKTSRTQPKAAKWIFSPAVWLRSLIKPGLVVRSLTSTGSSMEFLIAAAKAGDQLMAELVRHRQSIRRICQALRPGTGRRDQEVTRTSARALQGRMSRCAVRHADRNPGAAARRFHVCRARDAQPAPRAAQTVLGLG